MLTDRNSNQIDLRILKEMGVEIPRREKYEKKLTPRQKFRAGVFTVIAAMRISDLQEDWAGWKAVGEDLKARAASAAASAKAKSTKSKSQEPEREREQVRRVSVAANVSEGRRVKVREV